MKRKYLITIIGFILSFSLLSFPVYAADEPVQPIIPTEQTEETVTNYNSQVDTYNIQVDDYNKNIDETYNQQVQEYNETIEYNTQEEQSVIDYNTLEQEKVNAHNQEEDEKVAQNQEDLEQYQKDLEQYNEDLTAYEEALPQYEKDKTQYEADLKNEQTVKTYYGAESVEDYNMKPFKTPDEEEYNKVLEQAVDRKVVREENTALKDKEYSSTIAIAKASEEASISYVVSIIHHFVDNYFNDIHIETFEEEIDVNDTVTITSLANDNTGTKTVLEGDKKYPIFYTYISDKYLSYYWYESFAQAEYTALKNNNDFINEFENGDKYTYSLKNGKKYNSDTPYFSVNYYYMPYLTINKPIEPEEPIAPEIPEEIVEYQPDYWEPNFIEPKYKEAIEPVKGEYLNKLNYLKWDKPIEEEEKEPEPEKKVVPNEELEPRQPVNPSPEPVNVIPAPAPATPDTQIYTIPYVPYTYYRYPTTPLTTDSDITIIEDEDVPLASPVDPAKTSDNNINLIKKNLLIIICLGCLLAILIYFKKTEAER